MVLKRVCQVQTREGKVIVPYELHRSPRLRHLRVVVEGGQVQLKVPPRVPEKRAIQFLLGQGDWIARQLAAAPKRVPLIKYLFKNPRLAAGGKNCRLALKYKKGQKGWKFDWRGRRVVLYYNPWTSTEGQLTAALRDFASKVLRERAEILAKRMKAGFKRVIVRDQSSRWGSCSDRRTLSFNWRMVLLPPRLQDYLICHELAHLRVMDHSEKYWDVLARMDPRARLHDRKVTQMSAELMRLGRLPKKKTGPVQE